jgi:chloramphenicol 3-O-phosphotransferase
VTTEDQAAAHRATLERLGADGGPLTAQSKTATTQNSEWFNVRRGEPRQERRRLYDEILERFIQSRPEIRRDKKAIVLAGPPGAGKSTAQAALIQTTRTKPEHWLSINADDFKDELLRQVRRDGSYDGYLVPEEVRALEAAGEKFYPRELAALVHTESSILAKKARNEALASGMNVIIDGTLGNEKQARILLDRLQAAGYDVLVADVETTQGVSEARSMSRWERGYLDAENGTATGLDAELGGRWVPQSFPASLFNEPGDTESICAAHAAAIAADYGCVSEYQVYRVADKEAAPKLETTQGRARAGGPLIDSETLEAVRGASTIRRNSRNQANKGLDR